MNKFTPGVGHRPTCGEATEGPLGFFFWREVHALFLPVFPCEQRRRLMRAKRVFPWLQAANTPEKAAYRLLAAVQSESEALSEYVETPKARADRLACEFGMAA